jgi:hypothetical protein
MKNVLILAIVLISFASCKKQSVAPSSPTHGVINTGGSHIVTFNLSLDLPIANYNIANYVSDTSTVKITLNGVPINPDLLLSANYAGAGTMTSLTNKSNTTGYAGHPLAISAGDNLIITFSKTLLTDYTAPNNAINQLIVYEGTTSVTANSGLNSGWFTPLAATNAVPLTTTLTQDTYNGQYGNWSVSPNVYHVSITFTILASGKLAYNQTIY